MFRRRGQNGTPSTRLSLGADPHRGWMARQLETLAGIGDLRAVNLEDSGVRSAGLRCRRMDDDLRAVGNAQTGDRSAAR